jgi:hypothetical protein
MEGALEKMKLKVRPIHKENQKKEDNVRNEARDTVEKKVHLWIKELDLEGMIDDLAYPSDFGLFKRKAELFSITPWLTKDPLWEEVFNYFSPEALVKLFKQELPLKAPTSNITVKYSGERLHPIYVYYKGEKK